MSSPAHEARRAALVDAMERYADGDARAFELIYRELAPVVLACVRRWAGPDGAEDLCQQTFLRVHRARHRYRTGAPVGPWVLTIARNLATDALRRRGARKEHLSREETLPELPVLPEEPAEDVAAVIAAVRAAVAQLPDGQREVVALHKLEERSFAEVAEALGIKEGAARVRAHRAYDRLRRLLGRGEPG